MRFEILNEMKDLLVYSDIYLFSNICDQFYIINFIQKLHFYFLCTLRKSLFFYHQMYFNIWKKTTNDLIKIEKLINYA